MNKELKRKAVHISTAGFALCIGRFEPWLISTLCAVAFFSNLVVLPKLTNRALERDDDLARGYAVGMLMYPAILFVLSFVFFDQQVYMAVAWGAMAFGDGFAGLTGRQLGGPQVPWNRPKTWAGVLGFIVFGYGLTFGLLMLLPEESLLGIAKKEWALALPIAMAAAALSETVKGCIDDNFVVPTSAAAVTWYIHNIPGEPALPENWLIGAILVTILIVGSIASKKIDVPGGLVGGLLAAMIFIGSGLLGLSFLFAFFVIGSFASHWKMQEKAKLGLAQENKGKRSIRHAISNGGVAAICGLTGWFYPQWSAIAAVMVAASLASATADTLSSELGNVYGKRFINILTLKEDQHGLDGVISLEGSLFGAMGSVIIGILFFAMSSDLRSSVLIAAAGIFGNVIDSVLGASLQRKGFMSNDTVNFANTLSGALFIMLIY